MIYLASPYSHHDPRIRLQRFLHAREFVFAHVEDGECIYSPIVYCHQFSRDFSAPEDAGFWLPFNTAMLAKADEIWILALPGWKESVGVKQETTYAFDHGLKLTVKAPLYAI